MNFANVKGIEIPEGNVKSLSIGGVKVWEKQQPAPTLPYLCFTAEQANSTVGTVINGTFTLPVLEYSTDGTTWSNFALGSSGTVVTLANVGDRVYLRGDNSSFSKGAYQRIKFVMSGKIAASGNIMSLLDKSCESVTIPNTYCYRSMFSDCTSLTTAPELPATTLAEDCYSSMFYNCTSLTTAPELPATTLAGRCYGYMFQGCTSLTTAPELPATTLANYCYSFMFQGCTSLTTAPELPATTLAEDCYYYMFQGCTSLTTAPELPATTLAERCYYYMFSDCTSLTTAPELPATTLANYCYSFMFYNCASLTTAPELPATTLAEDCYSSMFYNCASLTTAPELPATTLAERCYGYMFRGCTSLYVSDTSGAGYDKAWNIPTTGVASGDYSMDYMFASCLGTRSTNSPNFSGTQKTYYTQNVPV